MKQIIAFGRWRVVEVTRTLTSFENARLVIGIMGNWMPRIPGVQIYDRDRYWYHHEGD